jgi:hypothetical protein
VAAQGGTVMASSAEGSGTTFTVRLPPMPPAGAPATPPAPGHEPAPALVPPTAPPTAVT